MHRGGRAIHKKVPVVGHLVTAQWVCYVTIKVLVGLKVFPTSLFELSPVKFPGQLERLSYGNFAVYLMIRFASEQSKVVVGREYCAAIY